MDYKYFECVHIAEADINDPDEMHAIAYADIDGYPPIEDGEGTVICRVWLLQGTEGSTEPSYLTDWHYNGYRMNNSVLECIEQAKKDLMHWFDAEVEQLADKAYQRYRLDWMMNRDYSLTSFACQLYCLFEQNIKDIHEAIDVFERHTDFGFGHTKEVWSPREKFLSEEWENETYMKKILMEAELPIWTRRNLSHPVTAGC